MRIIQLFMAKLKVWGQRAWLTTLRAFHITVALVFFAMAVFVGHKTYQAWRDYQNDTQEGIGMFYAGYAGVGAVTLLVILSLYSLLKARAIRS